MSDEDALRKAEESAALVAIGHPENRAQILSKQKQADKDRAAAMLRSLLARVPN